MSVVRAVKRVLVHKGDSGASRTFEVGEAIPDDWQPFIGSNRLVDRRLGHLEGDDGAGEVSEFPDFEKAKTIPDVLEWVNAPIVDGDVSADSLDERVARARHALDVEKNGKNRGTLMADLRQILDLDDESVDSAPDAGTGDADESWD